MNYQKHYDKLIKNAQERTTLIGYKELHHIIPRCMGGTDDNFNLVHLTLKEHYVAHHLLAKIHGGKLNYAWWMMINVHKSNLGFCSSVLYEKAKTSFIETRNNEYEMNQETKDKISKTLSGRKLPEQHRLNVISGMTEESKSKAYKNGLGKVNKLPRTEDWKSKISASNKGKPKSEEHKAALKLAAKTRKKTPQVHTEETCRYCGKTMRKSAITRFHNENCKVIK